MAESETMIARFDGDYSGLQKATEKAGQVVDGLAKRIGQSSSTISNTTNRIGLGFKALGGLIRSVTPFLDDATASMIHFGTLAADSLKNAFDAVSKFSGFLRGGLFLALAAVAAGIGYFAGKMLSGAAATEKAFAALERYNKAMRASNVALKAASDSWDTYTEDIKKAEQEFKLFGDEDEYLSAKLQATKKAIIGNDTSLVQLIDTQSQLESKIKSTMQAQDDLRASWDATVAARKVDMYESFLHWKTMGELESTIATLSLAYETNAAKIRTLTEAEAILREEHQRTKAIIGQRATAGKGNFAEMALPQGIVDSITEATEAYNILDGRVAKSRMNMQNQMLDFVASLAPTIEAVGMQFTQLWSTFSQGFGDAVARALVYGDDFGKAMKDLGKQLLSTLVSFLIQTVINTLLYGVLATLIQGGLAAGRIALQASIASAAAYAAAIETFGIAGFAAGPGLALAAAAGTAAAAQQGFGIGRAAAAGLGPMAVAGVGAFAEGGLITSPTLALVGEKGDELVLPLDRVKDILGDRGVTQVNVVLDDRTIAQAVVPWIPGIVHAKGVKGI